MKQMAIFHLLSCLGIADANYYYRAMAGRGWVPEKHAAGFDFFKNQESAKAEELAVFPVGRTELSDSDMENADLKLIMASKNYHVYQGSQETFSSFFTEEHFGSPGLLKLAALLVYSLACYYLLRDFFGFAGDMVLVLL